MGETAKNETFAHAVDAIEGANKFVHTTADRYLLTSSISNKQMSPVMFNNNAITDITKTVAVFHADPSKAGIQGQIRPILTILE